MNLLPSAQSSKVLSYHHQRSYQGPNQEYCCPQYYMCKLVTLAAQISKSSVQPKKEVDDVISLEEQMKNAPQTTGALYPESLSLSLIFPF